MTHETTPSDALVAQPQPLLLDGAAFERPVDPARSPALVYLASLAPGSRRAQRTALDAMARLASGGRCDCASFPWDLLRYEHTQAIRAILVERHAPGTVNRHLSALRRVLQEAWRLGLVDAETFQRAADLKSARGESLLAGRELSHGEMNALFSTCTGDEKATTGMRDACILALLYGAGLRRSELVSLDVSDVDGATGAITVRRGKGQKGRIVYAPAGARAALAAWLQHRGSEPGPLLCPVRKNGVIAVRPLTTQAIWNVCKKRREEAAVGGFSPHDLRRTWISHVLDAGGDIASVKKLAGHAHIATTERYDRRGEHAKKKTAELVHVPFVPGR